MLHLSISLRMKSRASFQYWALNEKQLSPKNAQKYFVSVWHDYTLCNLLNEGLCHLFSWIGMTEGNTMCILIESINYHHYRITSQWFRQTFHKVHRDFFPYLIRKLEEVWATLLETTLFYLFGKSDSSPHKLWHQISFLSNTTHQWSFWMFSRTPSALPKLNHGKCAAKQGWRKMT